MNGSLAWASIPLVGWPTARFASPSITRPRIISTTGLSAPCVLSPFWCGAFRRPWRQDRTASPGKAYELAACVRLHTDLIFRISGPPFRVSWNLSPIRCSRSAICYARGLASVVGRGRPATPAIAYDTLRVGATLPSGKGRTVLRWIHARGSSTMPGIRYLS